ncbi:MAG: phosphotransacetylase family protein [Deltaproteobacteria bacterium]|nr:phosphotransacetylase family protein [Deltaproteobacteria bacterium]MBW2077862.1 phosphotransacetylase family protein [Deltaproteobacteria bacterium]
MKKLVVASMRKSAGKTSVIVGIAKALNEDIGYIKPFGDRLLYRKKRLWDYDSALITDIFGLDESPEKISIGFEPSKLRYMYDAESMGTRLHELLSDVGKDKSMVFVEGGKDIGYGISVNLDAISVARYLNGKLLVVISGDDDTILDDITFLKTYLSNTEIDFCGVIVNKVRDVEDFKDVCLPQISKGVQVLGVIPYREEFTHFSVRYLAERLLAKVVAGEGGLHNPVKTILIGAMSPSTARSYPPFHEANKVVITGGDRSDMILASLETNTAGIIITGNILPPQNIISKAAERGVPLLSVPSDTFQTAIQIEHIEPLLTKDDVDKISLWEGIAREHIELSSI